MSAVVVTDHTHYRSLVIECPARCAERGCVDHVGQEWRESKRLPPNTSIDYARVLFERYAAEYHKSGPYRLVEYVTESKSTMEVIEP
jgi:hypothetical protein